MLDSLAVVPFPPQKDDVRAGRSTNSELIESEAFTTRCDDALTSGSRESESSDGELGDLRETLVVKDGTDSDNGLGVLGVGVAGFFDDSRDGDRRAIDLR